MKKFSLFLLLLVSINTALEAKKIPASDHDALAKEGIIILSEEHVRTPGVLSAPPVKIEIINSSNKTPPDKSH